jgi:hypothetical protein
VSYVRGIEGATEDPGFHSDVLATVFALTSRAASLSG